MKTTSSLAALTLSTAIALTACGPEKAEGGAPSGPSTSNSSTSRPSQTPGNSTSNGDSPSSTSRPAGGESSTSPSGRQGSENSAPAPEQASSIPAGPMTKATVIRAGGYRKSADSKFGEFYAVLEVDGTGPGKVKLQYELLDADHKVLGTVDDTIKVGQGKDMIKISTKVKQVPDHTKRIRLRVLENTPAKNADDITVTGVTVRNDAENDRPVITGNYAVHGTTSAYGFQAVCFDASDRVVVGHGLAASKGAKSGAFTVKLHEAPRHWKAQNCYVGQSGLAF